MAKSTIGISTMKSGKIIFADTGALFAAANTKDNDVSYVDATSFAVMERLGIRDAFSFDKHFEPYSLNRLPA